MKVLKKMTVYRVRLEYRDQKKEIWKNTGRVFNLEHPSRFLSTDVGSLASAQIMVQTAGGAVEPSTSEDAHDLPAGDTLRVVGGA